MSLCACLSACSVVHLLHGFGYLQGFPGACRSEGRHLQRTACLREGLAHKTRRCTSSHIQYTVVHAEMGRRPCIYLCIDWFTINLFVYVVCVVYIYIYIPTCVCVVCFALIYWLFFVDSAKHICIQYQSERVVVAIPRT